LARRICSSCSARRDRHGQNRGAFVVYIGTHGDAGAHRANVIPAGTAYTEKSGTYVNTKPRAADHRAASRPAGARGLGNLRALSVMLGKKLPFDSLPQCAPSFMANIRICPHRPGSGRSVDDVARAAKLGGRLTRAPSLRR